jgi:hypothetical protein
MKKFAIAGLISVLATIALSGCTSAPAETEEVVTDVPVVQEEVVTPEVAPVEEDVKMLTYESNTLEIKFQYPVGWNVTNDGAFIKKDDNNPSGDYAIGIRRSKAMRTIEEYEDNADYEKIMIDGREAYRSSDGAYVYLFNGIEAYSIENGIGMVRGEIDEEIFSSVVNSVQFLSEPVEEHEIVYTDEIIELTPSE